MRRTEIAAAAGVLLASMTACGSGEPSAAPTTTQTHTVTVTVPIAEPPTESPGDVETPPVSPPSNQSPPPITSSGNPVPLALSQAHTTVGDWDDNVYDAADRREINGLGVDVYSCGDGGNTPLIEYRLANEFSRVSLSVAQTNASPASDQILVLVLEGNGERLDVRQVPFNRIEDIEDIDISGVNAFRIRLYKAEEGCRRAGGSEDIEAVIEDLTVT